MSGESEIEKMVLNPTWKEVLLEMIANERLDPWNIDITALASAFLGKMQKMKTLELHVPANIILACAILLKYKSSALRFAEEVQPQEAYAEESAPEEIPKLELASRIPPKGPITLGDLMKEMERVMRYDEQKPQKTGGGETAITLPAPEFDIEEKMDSVFARVRERADQEGWATFSGLLESKSADEIICTLVPLLHMSQKKLVDLKQDEFFGEIFIRVN